MAATDATSVVPNRTLVPAGSDTHQIARLAAGIRQAAREAGVELSPAYAAKVAANGSKWCDQVGITRFGEGIVIHTAPANQAALPIVLGYADHSGQWHLDGHRHADKETDR